MFLNDIFENDDEMFSATSTLKIPCIVASGYRDFMDSRRVKSRLRELINDGDIKMLGRVYHEDPDIVEYYILSKNETEIWNIFSNLDRDGQFGGTIHSVWVPVKKRPVLDESEDMFALSKRVKTAQIIKRVLDEKYARYEEINNERDPRKFVDLSDELQEIDYLRNELARGGIKAYVRGLDSVSSDMVGSIGTELACNHDIGTQGLKDEYLDESEDDMFAPSNRTRAQKAIKDVLDTNYNRYMGHYNEIDPEQSGAEDMLNYYGDYLSDYDHLRSELARGGVTGFLRGLDMVSQDVINTVDSDLAIRHKVYMSDLENQYDPIDEDQLEEDTDPYDDEDMFAPSNRISASRDLSEVTAQLSRRYATYADTSTDEDAAELYTNESYFLGRASTAFLTGLRAGFKELEDVEDATTWEDLHDLCDRKGIDISSLADQYDAGELSESEDDDMFATTFKVVKSWSQWFNDCGGDSLGTSLVNDFVSGELKLRLNKLGLSPMGYFDFETRKVKGIFYTGRNRPADEAFGTISGRGYDTFAEYLTRDPNFAKLGGRVNESNEDDMFAPSNKPNLRKISTNQLRMLYQLSKGDSRPEYASAHKLQMAAIRAELERRNNGYVPTLEEQVNRPIGSHKGK
jgi:hypothetical protein